MSGDTVSHCRSLTHRPQSLTHSLLAGWRRWQQCNVDRPPCSHTPTVSHLSDRLIDRSISIEADGWPVSCVLLSCVLLSCVLCSVSCCLVCVLCRRLHPPSRPAVLSVSRDALRVARCALLVARCSLLVARCSLLVCHSLRCCCCCCFSCCCSCCSCSCCLAEYLRFCVDCFECLNDER